jgi:hypothetical protein
MFSKKEAEAIVQKWLDGLDMGQLAIAKVEEHDWGWMFLYDSKKGIETGDFRYALGGNCPVFVTRDGVFHNAVTSSAFPIEEHRAVFEERLKKQT